MFVPERWLPTEHPFHDKRFGNDVQEAAKPFSLGPRGCLGINLAHMEMRHALAKLVWTFDMRANTRMNDMNWEDAARFEGFWNVPSPMVRFDLREGIC
jgi:cytochrome P450